MNSDNQPLKCCKLTLQCSCVNLSMPRDQRPLLPLREATASELGGCGLGGGQSSIMWRVPSTTKADGEMLVDTKIGHDESSPSKSARQLSAINLWQWEAEISTSILVVLGLNALFPRG